MSIKLGDGKYEGDPDKLIEFFNKANLDISSALNIPKNYRIPNYLFWSTVILYILGLLGSHFCSSDGWKFISNTVCLIALSILCLFCYLKFKKISIAFFILIAGLVIYLFSTNIITNQDINDLATRSIDKALPKDTL